MIAGPRFEGGVYTWYADAPGLRVRFTGRGTPRTGAEAVAAVAPGTGAAWPRQVHSARVLTASAAGCCGEGDAVVLELPALAATVVTADCVPILLADSRSEGAIAAVHAGWRGLTTGVLGATLERMAAEPALLRAWVGPAIGPCCYEVGDEVAQRFEAAGLHATVQSPSAQTCGGKAHLDLQHAAEIQLRNAGVEAIDICHACTRCDERLWSYRRDGPGTGRNVAFLWREAHASFTA